MTSGDRSGGLDERDFYFHDLSVGWTYFHCGETFHSVATATQHFGAKPDAEPGCLLRVKRPELSMLYALRVAEQDRDEALVRLAACALA
jgi:hypothetical protein